MRAVLFIPIKLNNQRLPGKNTKLLNGIPLCEYLFSTVKEISDIDKKYVYCSSEEIIPYLPDGIEFLKRDPCLDGYQVKGLELIERFVADVDADVYVLAHVTQPFTRRESIVEGLKKVMSGEYDSAFSAIKLQDYLWYEGKPFNYDMKNIARTQDLEPVYMETGAFFIFTKEVFTGLRQRIGAKPYMCEVGNIEAIDIDTADDFEFAEALAEYLNKQ